MNVRVNVCGLWREMKVESQTNRQKHRHVGLGKKQLAKLKSGFF